MSTGAKFEIVSGYKGPPELFIAMERGEIDGVCGLDWSALKSQQPEWLRDKKLNLLVQASLEPEPELAALGVPTPWEYIKDDIDRQAVELMVGFQQAFGKAYLAPPGVPAEQVKTLRDAFATVLRDQEFLADAEKLRIEIAAADRRGHAARWSKLPIQPRGRCRPAQKDSRAIGAEARGSPL